MVDISEAGLEGGKGVDWDKLIRVIINNLS
jgi:hypothetical protein